MFSIFRTKLDDSESDLSYHLDLDSSFKRILNEKRQFTNKENNPPALEAANPSTLIDPLASPSTLVAPEKPLRKDLLKERLLNRIHDDSSSMFHTMDSSSYILDNSIGNDADATINRLMADFNINRDSVIGQKRTPLKSLKLSDASSHSFRSPLKLNFDEKNADAQQYDELSKSVTPADDTLEEIEYVLDRGLNYVPKRELELQKQQQENTSSDDTASTIQQNENDLNATYTDINSKNDDNVIVIDSSPENSFTTTQNTGHFKSIMESTENTFYTAKTDLNTKSTLSVPSINITGPSNESSSDEASNNSDIIVLGDDKQHSDDERTRDSGINRSASLNEIEKLNSTYDEMPEFNDTLERVDYMMQQGEKLMKNALTPNRSNRLTPNNTKRIATPNKIKRVDTPKLDKPKTPHTKHNTPEIGSSKKLLPKSGKKPIQKNLTPGKTDLFKRPVGSPLIQMKSASKIPTKIKSATVVSSVQKFKHIQSPIGAYINNTPEFPLMKTIKPAKNLLHNTAYVKPASGVSLDESTQSVESFPMKSPIPRKMYTAGSQRKVRLYFFFAVVRKSKFE